MAVEVRNVVELAATCGFVDPVAGRVDVGFVVSTTGGLKGVAVGSVPGGGSGATVEVSSGTRGSVVAVSLPGVVLSIGGREVLPAALVSAIASDGGDGGGVEGGVDARGDVDSGTSGTADEAGGGSVVVTSAIGAIVVATLVAVVGAGGLASVTVNRRTPLAMASLLDAVQRRTYGPDASAGRSRNASLADEPGFGTAMGTSTAFRERPIPRRTTGSANVNTTRNGRDSNWEPLTSVDSIRTGWAAVALGIDGAKKTSVNASTARGPRRIDRTRRSEMNMDSR